MSHDEGSREVVLLPSDGGDLRRLSYLGVSSNPRVSGWENDSTIFLSSGHRHPHWASEIYRLDVSVGAEPVPLNLGPAVNIVASRHGFVLEHNGHRPEPAWWKGYRGGLAGKFFYAKSLDDEFRPLVPFAAAHLTTPLWVGDRIFFVADPDGTAQVYSCDREGRGVKQHTKLKDFYARNPSTDGKHVVFTSGGDLLALDLRTNRTREIKVQCPSQRPQRQRRIVSAGTAFESVSLAPDAKSLALTFRGQVAEFGAWSGAVKLLEKPNDARYRLATRIGEKGLVWVSDASGEDELVYRAEPDAKPKALKGLRVGRVLAMVASPAGERVAILSNDNSHRLVDLKSGKAKLLRREDWAPLFDAAAFSPDGRYLAYSARTGYATAILRVYDADTGKTHDVTDEVTVDYAPSFDPEGRYLYFIGNRDLNPHWDHVHFNYGFPRASSAFLIPLRRDQLSPFLVPNEEEAKDASKADAKKTPAKNVKLVTTIDFEGIRERIQRFPVRLNGHLAKVCGLDKNRVLLLSWPVEGLLNQPWGPGASEPKGRLDVFDFSTQKLEPYYEGVSDVSVLGRGKHALLRVGSRVRIVGGEGKPDKAAADVSPKTGWIDLNRIQTIIEPAGEWRQMLREIWRLMRDHFWDPGMSRIDWKEVLARYLPLVERVSTRSEFSDLVWEMQGEMGTSHAYDIGGDYRLPPPIRVAKLGCDLERTARGYRIARIPKGDAWSETEFSPVAAPGLGLAVGDEIVEIDGRSLADRPIGELLLNKVQQEVELRVIPKGAKKLRAVRVKPSAGDLDLRYRDWVESRRDLVRELSKGRLGYIHIPDMSAPGFSEFHRHFVRDYDRDGLVVDFRYNGGGHVSPLLIEKLARKRLGIGRARLHRDYPFPEESPTGHMVGLTNEFAGSDGDMGPHQFKMRGLGPLIGKRSWGGVVGIWPRQSLVDGSFTTQPEFAHWFKDVGWDLENHGTTPDIEVEYLPHDYRKGVDPQLETAIKVLLERIESEGVWRPEVKELPDRRRGLTRPPKSR